MTNCLRRLRGHTRPPERLLAAPDGRTVISSGDRSIHVWDASAGALLHRIDDMDAGGRQPVLRLDVSPDGKYLATGVADFTTKVYTLDAGERIARLSDPIRDRSHAAELIRFSPDGRQLACARGQRIELFRAGNWKRSVILEGHTSRITDLAYTPDGSLLIISGGRFVKLWDPAAGTEQATLGGHARRVWCVAVNPQASMLAAGDDGGTILLRSLPDGVVRGAYVQDDGIFHVTFSPDGAVVASWSMSRELHLWDTTTQRTKWRRAGYEVARRVAFSPDGDWLAIACFGGVHVIDTRDGCTVDQLPDSRDVVFAPHGEWFATGDGNDVALWELRTSA